MLADIGWYLIPFLFAPGFCILVSAPSCPFIFLFGPLAKKQPASNWVDVDSVNPIPRGLELPQQFGSQWIQPLLVGLGVLKILRGRDYDGSEGIDSVLNTLCLSLNLIMSLWTPLKKSITGPHLSQVMTSCGGWNSNAQILHQIAVSWHRLVVSCGPQVHL